jgi:acetyl esterase/lipase
MMNALRTCGIAMLCAASCLPAATGNHPMKLWPGGAPGPKATSNPEVDTTKSSDNLVAGNRVIRLGNVTSPEMTFYPASASKNTGAVVLVFPGGGYRILALDLEGTEVCSWLNSIGVNAVLVKYRVPTPEHVARYQEPLEDAQRAIGLTRFHAKEWKIDPKKVGVIGFSAGGNLAAVMSTNFDKRAYSPIDEADQQSARPDFAMLIYPAYLVTPPDLNQIAPELHITADTPPTFLVQAEDDPVHMENSLFYYLALKRAKVPGEMHLYAKGGHGYGLRRTDLTITTWPQRADDWMRSLGVLKKSH